MSDLGELYQALILDHNAKPRNFGRLDGASHFAEGYNPLCGDKFNVYLLVAGDVIEDVRFEGSGCAISKASASLMTTSLKGKTVGEAKSIFEKFHALVKGEFDDEDMELGKLGAFAGVCEFPMRVKCAILSWHTMKGALDGQSEAISTE